MAVDRPRVEIFDRGETTHLSVVPPTPSDIDKIKRQLGQEFVTFEPSMLGDIGARANADDVQRCLGNTAMVVGHYAVPGSK